MSTIKSSAENLTLNADGANNDIIFQSNGSTKATLDQAGLLTATSFAGSAASLTGIADNTPSFGVRLSGNQSIANGSPTKIAWNVEDWDSDNAFASNKFTVASGKAGKYQFSGVVIMRNIDANELCSIRIHVNGSDSASGINHYRFNGMGTGSDTFVNCPISVVLNLSVNDYVEVFVYHNEGASQNVDAGYSRWSGFKLGGV